MQAITIAIGKAGIDFFVQNFLVTKLTTLLKELTPPNKQLTVPDFTGEGASKYQNIVVNLTQGSLPGFNPIFQSVTQGANGNFSLTMVTTVFFAEYSWNEQYVYTFCYPYFGAIQCDEPKNENHTYTYQQLIVQLSTVTDIRFTFNSTNNVWQITVQKCQGTATPGNASIPKDSILNKQDTTKCGLSSHVDDATAQGLANIDFATPINTLIHDILATIPGSGNIGNGILYDFSLNGSNLVFPNNDGIQMGIKGGASYNNTAFSNDTPPSLPLPAPLSDSNTHHLNMYVSNYEVDALTWSFYKAGKLNTIITASDLPNTDAYVLQVKTYADKLPLLIPYQLYDMQAQLVQNAAPITAFQLVYKINTSTLAQLQNQLPANVWQILDKNLKDNNYASKDSLESDLEGQNIDNSYYSIIEKATQSMAIVVNHDISFTLTILNGQPSQPEIVFSVKRTDILSNLKLGINSNQAQTMQFEFINATWEAQFISSSIPRFNGFSLSSIWGLAGAPNYNQLLNDLGFTGVPLPIMQGLQFDFTNAELSVQQGYISILANVVYQN